ncbi:MAG TPA: class I SAM-dependent methyltransferase [Candidatus Dormibacteraeota bacterium]|nr:class I SAM-dependent methyltransferase [Candidatus Dormibacteraeota bacterium]
MTALSEEEVAARDALVSRLFASTIGALELLHVYLGHRLGLYRVLAQDGPLTSSDLAGTAGISERYAREWLEEQAVAGILTVDAQRRFSLPAAHAEVLTDADSTNFLAPLPLGIVSVASIMPELMEAFRTGGGVPYEAYGADMRNNIADGNRPGFLNLLGTQWFPAVPELDTRLRAEPPAQVADIGCGAGWSSIGIALAYPNVMVHGFDLDAASIKEAKRNAGASGVADRVKFEIRDAADPKLGGSFDLVTAFETIHDMSNPVGALRAMRGLVRDGGFVLIADEKVAEEFTAPGDELERFMYGWSAVHCLPVGMVDPGSAGTGTVMRPSRLRQYARDAGFREVEVLPVNADFWRFYRLI